MAKGTKICKVCGKEYEYCKTNRPVDLFRWSDVACSPEHAAIYFKEIEESRKAAEPVAKKKAVRTVNKKVEETE